MLRYGRSWSNPTTRGNMACRRSTIADHGDLCFAKAPGQAKCNLNIDGVGHSEARREHSCLAICLDWGSDGLHVACAAQGYRLVVTGHSLGAGAAALISLKLRDRFEGGTLQFRSH